MIIAVDSVIYRIWDDFSYIKHEDFVAVGYGARIARGAHFVLNLDKPVLEYHLLTILEACEANINTVAAPFYYFKHDDGEIIKL